MPYRGPGGCAPAAFSTFEAWTILITHELVEYLTDPTGRGWCDNTPRRNEIGDL